MMQGKASAWACEKGSVCMQEKACACKGKCTPETVYGRTRWHRKENTEKRDGMRKKASTRAWERTSTRLQVRKWECDKETRHKKENKGMRKGVGFAKSMPSSIKSEWGRKEENKGERTREKVWESSTGKTPCKKVRGRKDGKLQAAKKGGEVSKTGVVRKGVRVWGEV